MQHTKQSYRYPTQFCIYRILNIMDGWLAGGRIRGYNNSSHSHSLIHSSWFPLPTFICFSFLYHTTCSFSFSFQYRWIPFFFSFFPKIFEKKNGIICIFWLVWWFRIEWSRIRSRRRRLINFIVRCGFMVSQIYKDPFLCTKLCSPKTSFVCLRTRGAKLN